MKREIRISDVLRNRLAEKASAGSGGFQSLAQQILDESKSGTLVLTDELRERIEHYAFDFGSGGWQSLLRDLIAEIEASESRL